MKVFLFFILSSIIFVFSVLMSKGDDVFKLTGIISFVAFPIYLFCMCYKKNFEKIKKQVQVCGNYDIKTLLYETYGKNQEKNIKFVVLVVVFLMKAIFALLVGVEITI